MSVDLVRGDCLIEMQNIADQSVNMIFCDLPYGTTFCKWDLIIPFEPLWKQYCRIIRPQGAIVLFGREPFSSMLRLSNIKDYQYDWIWEKDRAANFAAVRYQPLKYHETLSVFGKKLKYYPQMITRNSPRVRQGILHNNLAKSSFSSGLNSCDNYIERSFQKYDPSLKYPSTVLKYPRVQRGQHPTQKPTQLLEYLIKTYTNEKDLVLDNCMGSGSTGVACLNTNRKFLGIEKDDTYFEIAKRRIELTQQNIPNFLI